MATTHREAGRRMHQDQNYPKLVQTQMQVPNRTEHMTEQAGRGGQVLMWPLQHACRHHKYCTTLGTQWRWGSLPGSTSGLLPMTGPTATLYNCAVFRLGLDAIQKSLASRKKVSQLQAAHAGLNHGSVRDSGPCGSTMRWRRWRDKSICG